MYRYWVYGYNGEKYIAAFCYVGLDCLSLGVHVCLSSPNIELHVPFGFFRIGRKHSRHSNYVEIE